MALKIDVAFTYRVSSPTDALIQVEVAQTAEQRIIENRVVVSPEAAPPIPAESHVGVRRWVEADASIACEYTATVVVSRLPTDFATLSATRMVELNEDATRYLLPSRYCDVSLFETFAKREFGGLHGGQLVLAISDWTKSALEYVPGASDSNTTAADTFVARQGICRDYAHVFIALARASGIPARFVSCYAIGVIPQDFHAAAEVWLDGAWRFVDPSGMAKADETAFIGVGRDAADVAFLTTLGPAQFVDQFVRVSRSD